MIGPVSIVVDTNVFVASAFNAGSASRCTVEGLLDGRLKLHWTPATRAETRRILGKIPKVSWDAVSVLFVDSGQFEGELRLSDYSHVSGSLDREFLALAEAVAVPLISSDDDLLGPRERSSTPVFTPGEFVDWWEGQ